jgi:hypothetical protein
MGRSREIIRVKWKLIIARVNGKWYLLIENKELFIEEIGR